MTELSDYQRMVEKPHIASLEETIKSLREELDLARKGISKPIAGMPEWNSLDRSIQKAIESKADITANYTADLYEFIRKELAALSESSSQPAGVRMVKNTNA